MFIDPATGQPMDYTAASDQPLATGVPGEWSRPGPTAVRQLRPAPASPRTCGRRSGSPERGFAVNFNFNQQEQSGLSTLQAYTAAARCC